LYELASMNGCAVHAYCLMTNHIHLLVTPSNGDGCARLMRNLGQRYVQYFNRRYSRSGTLWEGRFRSCLVDSESYVLACYRYIELNPVRAGMVPGPIDYPWSSHAGNTCRVLNKLLTPHSEYLALSSDERARSRAYQDLFLQSDDPAFLSAVREATNGGFALLGERLRSALPLGMRQRLQRRSPGPRPQSEAAVPTLDIQAELGLRPRST
jgi:putative transposase